jgi:hypothetical protein
VAIPNNQNFTSFTSGTAFSASDTQYHPYVAVTNGTGADLYVRSDGAVAQAANDNFNGLVLPGQQRTFGNAQPKQPLMSSPVTGSAQAFGNSVQGSFSVATQAVTQELNEINGQSAPTYVSMVPIGTTPTGIVTVEFL